MSFKINLIDINRVGLEKKIPLPNNTNVTKDYSCVSNSQSTSLTLNIPSILNIGALSGIGGNPTLCTLSANTITIPSGFYLVNVTVSSTGNGINNFIWLNINGVPQTLRYTFQLGLSAINRTYTFLIPLNFLTENNTIQLFGQVGVTSLTNSISITRII
jgi:hypothetical protein